MHRNKLGDSAGGTTDGVGFLLFFFCYCHFINVIDGATKLNFNFTVET